MREKADDPSRLVALCTGVLGRAAAPQPESAAIPGEAPQMKYRMTGNGRAALMLDDGTVVETDSIAHIVLNKRSVTLQRNPFLATLYRSGGSTLSTNSLIWQDVE